MSKPKNIIIWLTQAVSFAAIGYSLSFYNHVYTISETTNIPQECIAQHNFMVTLLERLNKCEQNLDQFVELSEECGKALIECKENENDN